MNEQFRFVQELPPARRFVVRVRRNVGWIRTHGWAAVAEEHDWRPVVRLRRAARHAAWRKANPLSAGTAAPVFVVGAQRSGTNMVVHGFAESPSFQVFGEADRRAFERYKLRDLERIRGLVVRSQYGHALFKPLCDSHRTVELLDRLDTPTPPRAIWVYRGVEGRVRSSVAKFGDGNRQVLAAFCRGERLDHWQVQGISAASAAFVREVDPASSSPETGAALFWLIRNRLFIEQGLADRPDVLLLSYERFLQAPGATVQTICRFLVTPYDAGLHRHVSSRPSRHQGRLEIDPRVLAACKELEAQLDQFATAALDRGQ